MTRILLTGSEGQVGWELRRTLAPLGEVTALSRKELDLSKPGSIRDVMRTMKPRLVVNAAAYTAVDKAESEPELAMAVNGHAPGIFAEEARRAGAALVHYSTDYVFDGTKNGPYTEEDEPNPLNVYGRTKLAGDQAIRATGATHLILRTSWVYAARGRNFLLTILRLAGERDELRIVNDQTGAPTLSRSIAEVTARILTRHFLPRPSGMEDMTGTYNLTAAGAVSWFGFAEEILRLRGRDKSGPASGRIRKLVGISSEEYPTAAKRPRNSRLSCEKLKAVFGITMPSWKAGLALCMDEVTGHAVHAEAQ